MEDTEMRTLAALVRARRWAALATLSPDGPQASMAAYAFEADFSAFYLHLSRLAAHTRQLLADPRAALVVSEHDAGEADPQTDPQLLPRLSLQARAEVLTPGQPGFEAAAQCYLARFPPAEPRFAFADFELFRLVPRSARWVGGFGRAVSLDPSALQAAALLR